jgi:glycosyltransferase involved in cell wall biosynthesis
MNQIKVVHISTVDMSLRYMLLNQMLSIQEAGYDVSGISAPGPEIEAVKAAGIRYFPAPLSRSLSPVADLRALWELYQILRRERFTIVHTHTPKAGLLGQLAARMAGVPIVVNTIHGFYFHDNMAPFWRRFYITMEKIAARCSDLILSQNREDIETAIRERICRPEKIQYLGNGFDIQRFEQTCVDETVLAAKRRELGLPAGVPVVGFVGRLVAEKGILELLKAARLILQRLPATKFLIVGPIDYDKPDALTPAIADEYGLGDACIFTGRRHDMPELYALMDVLVLPSHREGFPRTPMEASLMGIPSVVTDVRGCREAVQHGQNGLLVPLGDVPKLAESILMVLTDRELAKRLGENGRRIAYERFDERKVFQKVQDEYARLLREKGFSLPPSRDSRRSSEFVASRLWQ